MKKAFLFLSLLSLLFLSYQSQAQNSHIKDYIAKYKDLAIQEMLRTGVPAAISLSQGIVESGAGTTWLSTHANNQFGIKCKSHWKGATVHKDDDRKNECFRKYPTAIDSWKDHSNFLKNRDRYQFLFYIDPLDYKAWAYGLKKAGYATNKRYPQLLIQAIEKYHLNQYSIRGLAIEIEKQKENTFSTPPAKPNPPAPKKQEKTTPSIQKKNTRYPSGIFVINKREVLHLPAETQLIGTAYKYHIPLKRLLRYNELNSDILSKDRLIYLHKKRKRGNHLKHIVKAGETYHEIAQKEGIRLKWLLKRNKLSGKSTPQAGDVLLLKGFVNEKGGTEKVSGVTHFFRSIFGKKKQTVSSHFIRYKVRKGDTLYQLSKRYHTSVKKIQKANRIKGSLIRVGQILKIPQR